MSYATVYVNGEAISFDDESEDMTLSVEFTDTDPDSVTCIHCSDDIAEYATDDGIRWLDSNNDAVCPGRDSDDDDDTHVPNSADNPADIANGAGVIVKGGAVRAWISVGEPRGAFQMSVWRGRNEDGTEARLLSVPYAADPMPHATLTPITDHTYRIGGERQGRRDEYATREIDSLPSAESYSLKIMPRGDDESASGGTKWMRITADELSAIRAILSRRVES